MSWNYRVMRSTDPDGTFTFGIHEVYYDEKGNPNAWTQRSVGVSGETFGELTRDFAHYQKAFTQPVLAIEADGDELWDIGLLGFRTKRSKKPSIRVWKKPSVPVAGQTQEPAS